MTSRLLSLATILSAGAFATACTTPASSTGLVSSAPVVATGAVVDAVPAVQPTSQWVMTCQPDQQARVTSIVRGGVQTSEVACVDAPSRIQAEARGTVSLPAAAPATLTPVAATDDGTVSLGEEPIAAARRTVRTTPAIYTVEDRAEPTVRSTRPVVARRSVRKSAIIIGSSAGAGAGLGAIVGGKKGALIGAAVGGGGAAIWDQVTRRK